MPPQIEHLNEPIAAYARRDFPELRHDFTVRQALETIRQEGIGEKVVYFYVVDEAGKLAGVLPTRRLLTAALDQKLSDVMIQRVVAIPANATILEACEMFVMHRFLAFPVIDDAKHVLGVVDVALFTEEVLDLGEREQTDSVFEALGFRVAQVRSASPLRAFRLRFPWLLSTIASGALCAVLASQFEFTIKRTLILAFFLTLVLALGESVAIQSMALSIQGLRSVKPNLAWFLQALRRESGTALLIGAASGLVVACIIVVWHGFGLAPFVIASSIAASLFFACIFGLSVPALLHWFELDPKIAAGPVTLALTDIVTLLAYFGLAALLL